MVVGFGAGVTWEIANPPELRVYDLEESGLFPNMVVQWPHDEGFRGTLAGIGMLEITEFGAGSGDVIAGTFEGLDMEPDPADPLDRVQAIDDGEFRCVVP